MEILIKENEYWYGGFVSEGINMPFQDTFLSLNVNKTYNQAMPLYISNQGRYIYSDEGFDLEIKDGKINITNNITDVTVNDDGANLREALLNAKNKFFPQNGKIPDKRMFLTPQYNTWIELIYNQNQEDVLGYAKNIIDNGFPKGIIMIDDMWQEDYGNWEFSNKRFPSPKEMIKELHDMGFLVMLWIAPFVSPDSLIFREFEKKGLLVKDKNGEPAIRKWWNGYSAILDFTNPEALKYFNDQCDYLMNEYKVDGFKFDAGDPEYYRFDDICHTKITPNKQSELWGKIGTKYELNEYRSCFQCGGEALVQRLCDKNHSWKGNGLDTLIPNGIAQGLMGYPFICPDMIGGGSYGDFLPENLRLDEELVIRYAQCSALFPMMQFSVAPWRVLSPFGLECCKKAAKLHEEFGEYILNEAKSSAKTGEPILRHMEYEFPHQGFYNVTNQFMLGSKILVAPVIEKGKTTVQVKLPGGKWKGNNGIIYEGGLNVTIDAPLDTLVYLIKQD